VESRLAVRALSVPNPAGELTGVERVWCAIFYLNHTGLKFERFKHSLLAACNKSAGSSDEGLGRDGRRFR